MLSFEPRTSHVFLTLSVFFHFYTGNVTAYVVKDNVEG